MAVVAVAHVVDPVMMSFNEVAQEREEQAADPCADDAAQAHCACRVGACMNTWDESCGPAALRRE